jgi:hypothetical protein
MLRRGEAFANELTHRTRQVGVELLNDLEGGLELLDLLLKLLRDLFALFLASVVEDGRPPLVRRFADGGLFGTWCGLTCRLSGLERIGFTERL